MSRYGGGYGGGGYGGYGGGGGGGYGGNRYGGRDRGRGHRNDGMGRDIGGAGHLARIHGTEEDRVNCPFYFKIGACRHGDGCSRKHNKPVFSQTVLVKHMYDNPILREDTLTQFQMLARQKGYHDQPDDEEFEDFYIDIFEELSKFGEIEEIVVCDNIGEHMVGHVYIKYFDEEDSAKCLENLNGRFFAGRQISCEFSPVTDFREARCRQYHDNQCSRNGECNFIHTKRISSSLNSDLMRLQKYSGKRSRPEKYERDRKRRSSSHTRSSSKKKRRRSRSRSNHSSGSRKDRSRRKRDDGKESRAEDEKKQSTEKSRESEAPAR